LRGCWDREALDVFQLRFQLHRVLGYLHTHSVLNVTSTPTPATKLGSLSIDTLAGNLIPVFNLHILFSTLANQFCCGPTTLPGLMTRKNPITSAAVNR